VVVLFASLKGSTKPPADHDPEQRFAYFAGGAQRRRKTSALSVIVVASAT
jgi:hypothetical protein